MSVSLAAPEHVEQIRETMRPLVFKGKAKLHWRDERPLRRSLIIQTLADLPISGLVVVRSRPLDPRERPERCRRKCLEHLLVTLEELGCAQLILESRGAKDDRRDREMVNYLRSARRVSSRLRLDHVPGPRDPGLWVADAPCGATMCDRVKDPQDHDYLATIRAKVPVEIIEV
jgi:hypothetical protein